MPRGGGQRRRAIPNPVRDVTCGQQLARISDISLKPVPGVQGKDYENEVKISSHNFHFNGCPSGILNCMKFLSFESSLTPDFVLTHFLLPTCCSDPPAVKLNWCPPQDENKPSATPSSFTVATGLTHFPLLVCIRLLLSSLNSSLWERKRKWFEQRNNKIRKKIGGSHYPRLALNRNPQSERLKNNQIRGPLFSKDMTWNNDNSVEKNLDT